ncbi:hypothetical protein ABBQ38_012738 [Trebouxia sp. C0009 RCD-2024]
MTAQVRTSPHGAELCTNATCFAQSEQNYSLSLRPRELIQDIINAVREYCAQGLDAMEGCAVGSLTLEPNELHEFLKAGSAAQLAAIGSVSGQENLAEGASAMVSAALRLQPLLARAQKLRAKDEAIPLASMKNMNAGILAEAEIIKQESLVNSLPMDRLQMLAQVLQGGPNN